jgi:hypothetical protein
VRVDGVERHVQAASGLAGRESRGHEAQHVELTLRLVLSWASPPSPDTPARLLPGSSQVARIRHRLDDPLGLGEEAARIGCPAEGVASPGQGEQELSEHERFTHGAHVGERIGEYCLTLGGPALGD